MNTLKIICRSWRGVTYDNGKYRLLTGQALKVYAGTLRTDAGKSVAITTGAVLMDGKTGDLICGERGVYRCSVSAKTLLKSIKFRDEGDAFGVAHWLAYTNYTAHPVPCAPITQRLPPLGVAFIAWWNEASHAQIYPERQEGAAKSLMSYIDEDLSELPVKYEQETGLRLVTPDPDGKVELWDCTSKSLRKFRVMNVPLTNIAGEILNEIFERDVQQALVGAGYREIGAVKSAYLALVPHEAYRMPIAEERCRVRYDDEGYPEDPIPEHQVEVRVKFLEGVSQDASLWAATDPDGVRWVRYCMAAA